MAKGKKTEVLVPIDEQPYLIPKNWQWVYLTDGYAECKDSFRKPINSTERAGRVGAIPYYGATGQVGWIDDFLTDEELVLLGEDGAPFLDLYKDKAYIINGKAWVNNHAHVLKSYYGHAGNICLMHYLNIFNFTGYVNGTTRMKLTQASMDTIPVPLPPIPEQQRIVDRIESLFAKLDEAKEKAQVVVEGFEDRKAAILHQAFTGELTAKWRKKNKISDDMWEKRELQSCANVIGDGLHGTPVYDNNGQYYFINGNNFVDDHIEIKPDTKTVNQNEYKKYYIALSKERTVFVSINGTLGKTAFYNDEPVILGKSACYVNVNEKLNKFFLRYFFESKEFLSYANEKATGSTIKNLGLKAMRGLLIDLPSLDEQAEIVRQLDHFCSNENEVYTIAKRVISQIDTMKKAILARAFRGELGTNDPSEPPAPIEIT